MIMTVVLIIKIMMMMITMMMMILIKRQKEYCVSGVVFGVDVDTINTGLMEMNTQVFNFL